MTVRILVGDALDRLRGLPDESVHCCVTSPPYWGLRDYNVDGQLGLEETPESYVAGMVEVFREVRRVLRSDGTLWLNIGDSYVSAPMASQGKNGWLYGRGVSDARLKFRKSPAGLKRKDLVGIPWRLAFALQADGWYLRSDIIWSKPCPLPESVTDRPSKAHEYVFLLSRSERYFYDADAVRTPLSGKTRSTFGTTRNPIGDGSGFVKGENYAADVPDRKPRLKGDGSEAGANLRTVWTVASQPFPDAHFATFPPRLIEPCVRAGCPEGGTVLDPFGGAGTTGLVADRLQRDAVLVELNPDYAEMARRRIEKDGGMFTEVEVRAA